MPQTPNVLHKGRRKASDLMDGLAITYLKPLSYDVH